MIKVRTHDRERLWRLRVARGPLGELQHRNEERTRIWILSCHRLEYLLRQQYVRCLLRDVRPRQVIHDPGPRLRVRLYVIQTSQQFLVE